MNAGHVCQEGPFQTHIKVSAAGSGAHRSRHFRSAQIAHDYFEIGPRGECSGECSLQNGMLCTDRFVPPREYQYAHFRHQ